VEAYAARNGGPLVTPQGAGAALVELMTQTSADVRFRLSAQRRRLEAAALTKRPAAR
jgi:hypothetical protein